MGLNSVVSLILIKAAVFAEMNSMNMIDLVHHYPIIYKIQIQQKCFDDVLHTFVDDILQQARCDKVESSIISYISRVIEPVGWQAVWQASQQSLSLDVECDFWVEVNDVSLEKLEADVCVKSVLVPTASLTFQVDDSIHEKFKNTNLITVPLVELYPISEGDDQEVYAKTAIAIEHVRLFYQHLYRPWDIEEDDTFFTEKILCPRLQLYFDIKNRILPQVLISKIESILKEAWDIMDSLKSLYSNMHVSDSEVDLSDEDVYATYELRKRIRDIKREMEILENPDMRRIIMENVTTRKSPVKPLHRHGAVTTIVAHDVTFEMIMNLQLPPNTFLKFCHCPESAVKTSYKDDTVLIFPGDYRCDTFGWLEEGITIRGVGPSGSVRIKATGNSDVFVNCDSHGIVFENLNFLTASGTVSAVVVHHGSVFMKNVEIDSNGSLTGVILLGGTELTMEDSEIANAKEDGIQLRPASVLKLKSSRIVTCGRNGIQIDVDENLSAPDPGTEIFFTDSFVVSNEGYGVYVNTAPSKQKRELGDDACESSTLNSFPWLKHHIHNSVLGHNKHIGIGSGPTYKYVKHISTHASEDLKDVPT